MKNEFTKAVVIEELLAFFESASVDSVGRVPIDRVLEVLTKEKETLLKKKVSSRTENKDLENLVLSALEDLGEFVQVNELIKKSTALSNYTYVVGGEEKSLTSSKVTSVLRKLVEGGLIENKKDGKKSLYGAK